jgi:hypothetical protein
LADAIEKRVAAATSRTEKLTQAILAKSFRGELVPTEAELARREGRSDAEKDWKPDGTSSCWIGAVHACLGEKDAAFEWLERAFNERASFMVFLKTHPLFVDLHEDPRFDALVKRIGIPD